MQFSIFSKNCLYSLQKSNLPHNCRPSLKSKFSEPPQDFLVKFSSLPHFGRRGACHDITKSADSQTNNKSSGNDSMTAEFYKNVYQKTYLPKDFRLRITGNKKVLEKSQIGWRQMLVPSLPSRNKVLVNNSQKLHRSRFQSFLILSNFA